MSARPSPRHSEGPASTGGEDTASTTPGGTRIPTTIERRKKLDALIWGGILLSVALHFVFLNVLPDFESPDFTVSTSELEISELPPEVEIPPPPEAIARPAVPVVAENFDVDPDITIAPTTFAANPVEDLPPPPEEESSAQEIYEAPTYTPYSVAPDLRNRKEAAAAVMREWPPALKNSGIEGVVTVWIFINEDGRVTNAEVSESSGLKQMDEAALRAARAFRFSPALNRDEAVPVWVELPISFTHGDRSRLAG